MSADIKPSKLQGWSNRLGSLDIARAVRLVWSSASRWTAAGFILQALQGILPLASLYMIKLIVDAVVPGQDSSFIHILILAALAGVIAILNIAARSASELVNENQSALVSDHIQDVLHAKSIEADLEYYENAKYHDTLHRAQQEAMWRPTTIVVGLAQLGQNAISMLGVMALLINLNWIIAVIMLAASLPAVFLRLRYAKRLYQWQNRATERERRAWYLHLLLTSEKYAKELRLFDLGNLFKERYRDLRQDLRQENLAIKTRRSAAGLASQSFAAIILFGFLIYVANQARLGLITVGDMVMYFGALQQAQSFLQNILNSLANLYENNLFLSNLYQFLDLQPKVQEPLQPQPFPRPMRKGISFEKVSFSFPGERRTVLEGVSLHINPGQTVALVGENGSGKTTMVKLLSRLYDPIAGRISIDGIDLKDFKLSDLRRDMSIILQDYARYNLTAWENIWLGDIRNPVEMALIQSAAESSGIHKTLQDLKDGYQTQLGKWFRDGAELSEGEWQKVALARAFLSKSQIIILDEPTSSLDPGAEDAVIAKFRELARGRTAIIISHRLSTVKSSDLIFFLKEGKLAESGTHEELIEKSGEYARLFEIQAQHYR